MRAADPKWIQTAARHVPAFAAAGKTRKVAPVIDN
jgi:hypothetical protein